MSRIEQAIVARGALGEDFFGGWLPSDRDLLEKYARAVPAQPGMITDFTGVMIRTVFHPWAAHLDGCTLGGLPIPDDSLRAEAIEYVALLTAFEAAPQDSFAIAELGASYGPWACLGGVLAKRAGKSRITLVAVEASETHFQLIPQHLRDNGIDPDQPAVRLFKAAVSAARETLYFPKVSDAGDNGGQAVSTLGDTDYVGRVVEHEPVQGITVADILGDDVFDLVHFDIQGGEAAVLSGAIEVLNRSVRHLFIGTHARLIEGQLLELLHANGWELLRERPTRYAYHAQRRDVVGWTTRDGAQFWRNPRFFA